MKKAKFIIKIIALVSGAKVIFNGLLRYGMLLLLYPNAASIGVIGGADGPTAIYVSGKMPPVIFAIAETVIFSISLVGWVILHHKTKEIGKNI